MDATLACSALRCSALLWLRGCCLRLELPGGHDCDCGSRQERNHDDDEEQEQEQEQGLTTDREGDVFRGPLGQ